jgi:ribA/ribD-fused uncharacterized protein
METIRFNSRTPEYRWLSNFGEGGIDDGSRRWPTAEHFYQGQKCVDPAESEAVRQQPTAAAAKQLGKQVKMAANWNQRRREVMLAALWLKFTQNGTLGERLLATGTALLVHEAPWDPYWGTGRDGRGQNQLGVLLMQVRKELLEMRDQRADPKKGAGSMTEVVFYTDGACTNNNDRTKPGQMGAGIVAVAGTHKKEYSVPLGVGTNQKAEILAVYEALSRLKGDLSAYSVRVVSDSEYVIGCLTQPWKPKANLEELALVHAYLQELGRFTMEKVKGHAGHPENERADQLAVIATGEALQRKLAAADDPLTDDRYGR